jgi:hypothetical protein
VITPPRRGHRETELVASFRTDGFVVLPQAIDPAPLSAEVDAALQHGLQPDRGRIAGAEGVEFHSVVMMNERTPVSLGLVDDLARVAASLLDRPVLPGRAKATRYFGSSGLHADSESTVPSLGVVAYLEPLDADTGALRVVPGSHRDGTTPDASAVRALATEPGDLIVFDEHLVHGSSGGAVRRQWRVDFVADPMGPQEEALVRTMFAGLFDPDWDGGDDVDRYPSYGAYWQTLDRPWTERLRELGVYDLAARHAASVRARRNAR